MWLDAHRLLLNLDHVYQVYVHGSLLHVRGRGIEEVIDCDSAEHAEETFNRLREQISNQLPKGVIKLE